MARPTHSKSSHTAPRSFALLTNSSAQKLDALQEKLAAIDGQSHAVLKEIWQEVFDHEPPKALSRRIMTYVLAYELQVQAFGGLKRKIKQELLARATALNLTLRRGRRTNGIVPPPSVTLNPGTRLMREWHGVMHVVDVREGGFVWNGRTFKSLSAIARAITGARWNGLAFFGLRKKQVDNAREIAA